MNKSELLDECTNFDNKIQPIEMIHALNLVKK